MRTLLSTTHTLRRHARGVTLIELMVAVALGAFLMIGAMNVFMQSRTTFRINQSVARLQENARFVLATIEPDIRMANYYGLTNNSVQIAGRAKTTVANGIGPSSCGANWTIDLDTPVTGSNNTYPWPALTCGATGGYQPATDTITIRRVVDNATLPGLLGVNTLYVYSQRAATGQIFIPPVPGSVLPGGQSFQLVASGYYISRQSASLGAKGTTIPSLHHKWLKGNPPSIQDDEILPGVEDLQVEFGIDTNAPGGAGRGAIDRYVNPGDPLLTGANTVVLAVRIWLRLRAEDIENGFTDATTYTYADVNYTPPVAARPFRRLLISKTIYLRNARPMT
jgi:type IV pilus assembly protein PilW